MRRGWLRAVTQTRSDEEDGSRSSQKYLGQAADAGLRVGLVYEGGGLRRAAEALAQGSEKTDQPRGRLIADFLASGEADRVTSLDDYARAFLTKTGTILANLATKQAVKTLPDVIEIMQREAERILALKQRLKAAELVEATKALLSLGKDILDRYDAIKESHVALDYDDLILTARDLLRRPGIAPWVLFKLDGGLDHILVDEAQDTNPAQWEVIKALAEEFFVGEGAAPSKTRVSGATT